MLIFFRNSTFNRTVRLIKSAEYSSLQKFSLTVFSYCFASKSRDFFSATVFELVYSITALIFSSFQIEQTHIYWNFDCPIPILLGASDLLRQMRLKIPKH